MSLSRMGTRMWKSICKQYQAQVAAELNVYGLKYDDTIIETDPDYQKALSRLPPEELRNRARRMKRAFDISLKEKTLPEDLQALQKPLDGYVTALMEDAKNRRIERELLNKYD